MAKATATRAALRRAICRKLRMPFYRRYETTSTLTGSPTTTALTDGSLGQSDDFWNEKWVYMASGDASGDVRLISDFGGGTITPERALSSAPSAADGYEILSTWSPFAVHDAINESIQSSDRVFFSVVEDDDTFIIEEDKMEYDLTNLSTAPWIVCKIFIERSTSVDRGTATSGGADHLTDSSQDYSSLTTNFKMSIYDGTGKGQLRNVSSGDANGKVTPTVNWTTNPDSTSKYALWDATKHEIDWYRLTAARFDDKEYPSKLYLTRNYPTLVGMRIRLVYTAIPSTLSSDTDTTIVPQEYVVNKALSTLYAMKADDNRADRQRYMTLSVLHDERAEQIASRAQWRIPDITVWEDEDLVLPNFGDYENPLGW